MNWFLTMRLWESFSFLWNEARAHYEVTLHRELIHNWVQCRGKRIVGRTGCEWGLGDGEAYFSQNIWTRFKTSKPKTFLITKQVKLPVWLSAWIKRCFKIDWVCSKNKNKKKLPLNYKQLEKDRTADRALVVRLIMIARSACQFIDRACGNKWAYKIQPEVLVKSYKARHLP